MSARNNTLASPGLPLWNTCTEREREVEGSARGTEAEREGQRGGEKDRGREKGTVGQRERKRDIGRARGRWGRRLATWTFLKPSSPGENVTFEVDRSTWLSVTNTCREREREREREKERKGLVFRVSGAWFRVSSFGFRV